MAVIILWFAPNWWLLAAILIGICWQQSGWLAHDYCHHQVFSNRRFNNIFGYFFGNVVQGMSVLWWKDRHNSHHATANVLGNDPDLDNLPIFLWDKSDLPRLLGWKVPFTLLRYQAWYFLPFMTLIRSIWCLQSAAYVIATLPNIENTHFRKMMRPERITLALHYVWLALVLLLLPSIWVVVPFLLVSELLAGFGIGIVVFFNHYACEHFDSFDNGSAWIWDPRMKKHVESKREISRPPTFVELQLRSTRNMAGSPIVDWISGGINYQVEHHLFPTLPRNNLSKASRLVREFCKENSLPYQCDGFWEGTIHTIAHLSKMARLYCQPND